MPVFLATVVLIAAHALLPAAAGAGLLTACSAGVAVATFRAAAANRAAGPRLRAVVLAAGMLFIAVAGAASGVTVLVKPAAMAGDVPLAVEIPLVALFLAAVLFLPAILRPHQRRDQLTRLRVGLDILGVTACLIFPPWLLLFAGTAERRGASITALIFGAGAAATVAVTGMHAIRHRAALQWCGPGAGLSLVGLTALVVAMDAPDRPNASIAAVAAGGAINVAAALMWYGSVRIHPDGSPIPPAGSESSVTFPLFAVPILGSALVTVYHLINGGRLDSVAVILGATAILAVAAREWTSAVALRRHADHLADQGNRLRSLMFGAADVAMILDGDLAVRWQSPAAARQFGLSDQDVLGRPATALVHPDQAGAVLRFLAERMAGRTPPADSVAVRLRDGFGRWRDTEWTTSGADPAEPGRTLVVHVRDVSTLRDLEQALREAAHLDQPTSLANREGLRRAGELVSDAGALIVVELGGLTAIGDVHGADLAEVVVVEAARRLRGCADSADVPARVGETRLAVLTRSGAVRAHLLASRLLNSLTAPYTAAGTVAHLSAWAGLTDVTADADIDEVVRRATLALRSVRSGPPGAIEWYDEEMETRLLRRSTLEQDLPGALTRGELDLRYQPIVELTGRGRPVGAEALLTWRHPTLGTVPAAELLPLAEELGLLPKIGHWALHRSCRLLADWRQTHESLWLAVNVRPRELVSPSFQASLQTALESYEIPPSAVVLEIAEEDLMPPVEDLAAHLGRLRAEGVRTAVDNFGAGPTSLSRLRVLPIDLLKIDRDVFGQPDGAFRQIGPVMDVTVALGQRLGLDVIAHGLQTAADIDTVKAAGCRLGQGDLLGQPMPAEHFEALLEVHRKSHRRA